MSENQAPGCCGDFRCQGCAWECVEPEGHDEAYDPALEVMVCSHCGNKSPNLAVRTKKASGERP